MKSLSFMKHVEDSEIIAAVLAGDGEAFGTLLHRYRDVCTRFAVRMLGSRADADDVLQLAFIRAFRGLRGCRDPQRFGGWLFQIVVNESRTFAARRRRREERFVTDSEMVDRALAAEESDSGELSDHVEAAVNALPADQREAFLLKYVEELSYEEISEITGVGISALKMRVKRACGGLRDMLEGAYHGSKAS